MVKGNDDDAVGCDDDDDDDNTTAGTDIDAVCSDTATATDDDDDDASLCLASGLLAILSLSRCFRILKAGLLASLGLTSSAGAGASKVGSTKTGTTGTDTNGIDTDDDDIRSFFLSGSFHVVIGASFSLRRLASVPKFFHPLLSTLSSSLSSVVAVVVPSKIVKFELLDLGCFTGTDFDDDDDDAIPPPCLRLDDDDDCAIDDDDTTPSIGLFSSFLLLLVVGLLLLLLLLSSSPFSAMLM